MADDAPGAMPVRGTLKVEIGTSSTVLEAGRPFSVLVTIQNPFDVPVEITAVTTVVPIEFIDLERRKYEHERDQSLSRAQKIADDMLKDISPDLPSDKKKRAITELILSAAHMLPFGSLFRVAYNASQVIVASSTSAPTANIASSVDIDKIKAEMVEAASSPGQDKVAAYQKAMDAVKAQLEQLENSRLSSSILNPGNSIIKIFTLQTNRSVFFPPSSYEIPIQISYKIASVANQDSVKYRLSVRSPLNAVIFGATLGSIAGFLLKDIFEERVIVSILNGSGWSGFTVWLIALFGNIILAIVAVVAFARKRDTQPFISVEDFWGGLFVGAVAGYAGKSMIHGLLVPKNA